MLLQEGSAEGQQDERVRLRDMLVPYRPPEVEQRPDEVEKRLERLIDQVRRQLVDARMVTRFTANDEQGRTFEVRVQSGVLVPGIVSGWCRMLYAASFLRAGHRRAYFGGRPSDCFLQINGL